MLMETFTDREYHPNGKIKYQGIWSKLSTAHAHLYEHRRVNEKEGFEWVWSGLCGRWDENGRQIWVIQFNNRGEVMKNVTDQLDLF